MLASMLYVHFNVTVGFNPTALYIYDKERCPILGLHDKPAKFNAGYNSCFNDLCTKKKITLTLSLECGSIPHHYTFMTIQCSKYKK